MLAGLNKVELLGGLLLAFGQAGTTILARILNEVSAYAPTTYLVLFWHKALLHRLEE